jgi:hypothetical protein
VEGSPRISLFDHARELPFDYRYEVPHAGELWRSRPVLLRPDEVAYFFVTQFRCEGKSGYEASEMHALLPAAKRTLDVALPAGGGAYGVSTITYCTAPPGDARREPGNRIEVTVIHAIRPACNNGSVPDCEEESRDTHAEEGTKALETPKEVATRTREEDRAARLDSRKD